jgi:hypothetical protein
MAGPAMQLRALRARGAAMPMCAPSDFAERLARVGVPLAPVVVPVAPIGQPVRPLVTRVTGATPPQLAGEGRDAPVTTGVIPAMPDGAWL